MTVQIKAEFQITSWDETPFDEGTGIAKLTEALVSKEYSGEIDATSTTKWLMAYAPDQTAQFIGLERIKGTIGGKHGSLVLQHVGTFETGRPTRRSPSYPARTNSRLSPAVANSRPTPPVR